MVTAQFFEESNVFRIVCQILYSVGVHTKTRSSEMNIAPVTGHQTIILGLEIFLDQLSSRTIDQKFLMIYLVHLSSLEVDMDQFEVCLVYSVRWSGWSGWSSKFILIHQSSS